MSAPDWIEWADDEKKRRRENGAPPCSVCGLRKPGTCHPFSHRLACPVVFVGRPGEYITEESVRDAG